MAKPHSNGVVVPRSKCFTSSCPRDVTSLGAFEAQLHTATHVECVLHFTPKQLTSVSNPSLMNSLSGHSLLYYVMATLVCRIRHATRYASDHVIRAVIHRLGCRETVLKNIALVVFVSTHCHCCYTITRRPFTRVWSGVFEWG